MKTYLVSFAVGLAILYGLGWVWNNGYKHGEEAAAVRILGGAAKYVQQHCQPSQPEEPLYQKSL
jgi:hypothetical protein